MKCLNCRKEITSGILLFIGKGTYSSMGIDPSSYKYIPIQRHNVERIIAFCNVNCENGFYLNDRWFNKSELPLSRRLKSLQQVREELQSAFLRSNDDNEKDLIDCLRYSL